MKFYGSRRNAAYLRKRKRQTRRSATRMTGALGCLAASLALMGAMTVFSRAALKTGANGAEKPQPEAAHAASEPERDAPAETALAEGRAPASRCEGVYNILLCGTDEDGLRTDTIMIGHLNERTGRAALMSIPRDTAVEAEDGSLMKLNAVYAGAGRAGMERLRACVGALLGFAPDGYVLVDMDALRRSVDILGGVEFDVPQDMDYSDPAQGLEIHLKAGRRTLSGEQALQLVRYRKGYAMQDIRRTEIQRAFLKALGKQCLSVKGLTKLPELLRVFREEVTTDLSTGNILYLARMLAGCDLSSMESCTLAGEGVTVNGVSYYPLYAGRLLETVNRAFNPFETEITMEDIHVITPELAARHQKPRSQKPAEEKEAPEQAPARTEIVPMPNDPSLWER